MPIKFAPLSLSISFGLTWHAMKRLKANINISVDKSLASSKLTVNIVRQGNTVPYHLGVVWSNLFCISSTLIGLKKSIFVYVNGCSLNESLSSGSSYIICALNLTFCCLQVKQSWIIDLASFFP